jgi:ATP-dependent Zn protease
MQLAAITSGFSGAALENLVNEAALYAIKKGLKKIDTDAFTAVKDKVQYGKKQPLPLTAEEKATLAYYQSAKAITAKNLGLLFEKISLFENSFLPDENSLDSDQKARMQIAAQLSGIIAYDLHYGTRFNNIKEDLEQVRSMIERYLSEFDLERVMTYESLLEKATDMAAKTIKKQQAAIAVLTEKLMQNEVVVFDDITV